jgi:hypothetical protein
MDSLEKNIRMIGNRVNGAVAEVAGVPIRHFIIIMNLDQLSVEFVDLRI